MHLQGIPGADRRPEFQGLLSLYALLQGKITRKEENKMAEITLNAKNFEEEVIKSDIPVLVDFWATWCGPCKMLAPTIEEIAKEYDGRLKVGKVNIDDEGTLAIEYGIVSIPTVILFSGGEAVSKSVGFVPKEELEEAFKGLI